MPLVNVIFPDNGFGFSTDLEVVRGPLQAAGYTINVCGMSYGRRRRLQAVVTNTVRMRGRPDLNLFLGPVFREWLPLARRNAIVPNQEWFAPNWVRLLASFDRVFAKTRLTERLFAAFGAKTVFTSFTSTDCLRPDVAKDDVSVLHVASNKFKGTAAVLAAWRARPDWPKLTAVINRYDGPLARNGNIEIIRDYLPRPALIALQNRHPIHVCCSEAEGFGHYIVEAMSTKSVVITTNAPPMNELVDQTRGLLVEPSAEETLNISRRVIVEPGRVAAAIDRALAMPQAARAALGEAARRWFLANDAEFHGRFAQALESLAQPSKVARAAMTPLG